MKLINILKFPFHLLRRCIGPEKYEVFRYYAYKLLPSQGYSSRYYAGIEIGNSHSYKLFADTIWNRFRPGVLVDVGCGAGGISQAFLKAGCVDAFCFDFSRDAVAIAREKGLPHVERLDLTAVDEIPAKGDLCICLEVAEHLPGSYQDHLCHILSQVAPRLIFTAAPPGQGGHLHVNTQPKEVWINNFRQHGMFYDEASVQQILNEFGGRMIRDYSQNLMIFKRDIG